MQHSMTQISSCSISTPLIAYSSLCNALLSSLLKASRPTSNHPLACVSTPAGTVLGANHGVARNAILHPIKVMAADGSGSYSNIISAMGW